MLHKLIRLSATLLTVASLICIFSSCESVPPANSVPSAHTVAVSITPSPAATAIEIAASATTPVSPAASVTASATPVPSAAGTLAPTPSPSTATASDGSAEESQSDEEPSESVTIDIPDVPSFHPGSGDIANLAGEDVIGSWLNSDSSKKHVFYENGATEEYFAHNGGWALSNVGTYTFNRLTGEGTVQLSATYSVDFTVDGDVLLWSGCFEYYRE